MASTESDFELIVSDNCSPRQNEVVQALAPFANDPRFTLVTQAENLGEARNRHFLMRRASAPYRIIIGDDDLLAPHALRQLRTEIQTAPGRDIYLFGYEIIDEYGQRFETRRALAPVEINVGSKRAVEDLFSSDLFPFGLYHPATFCFHASLHEDIVPNHAIGIGDDIIFLFDAIIAGKRARVVPDVLFSYRKFMASSGYAQTNLSRGRLANVVTRRHILYALLGRKDLPPQIGAFVRSRTFRQRFLYNPLVLDPDATEATIDDLGLQPEHAAELRAGWCIRRRGWFRRWLQIRRACTYVRYFGIRGVSELARVAWQRRAYRAQLQTD